MQDFKKLRAWHAGESLALDVFRACIPKVFGRYPGLRSQTLRTANSISSNISEGAAKEGIEFAHYLGVSLGATNELENHLSFAAKAGLLPADVFEELARKVDLERRMIIKLRTRVLAQAKRLAVTARLRKK